MSEFMTVDHPRAFEGMTLDPHKELRIKHYPEETHLCPLCKGYGGWHLQFDAYGPGKHFDSSCFQCNGWGYVSAKDADHIHKYGPGTTVGHCLNNYTCEICNQVRTVDSSD